MKNIENLIIIGSGPAGYTAAIYAARAGLRPIVLAGPQPGGQLTTTTVVENFPGFENGVDAFTLVTAWAEQAKKLGTRVLDTTVTLLEHEKEVKKVFTQDGACFGAYAVIIATGARAKWLQIEGEEYYKNRGISACATCDGFAFKEKRVVVIGGGDTAFEEALYLTNLCSKVYLMYRRSWSDFRASRTMIERARVNPKISFILDATIQSFYGDDSKLRGVSYLHNKEVHTLEVDGAFVAIGHEPNTGFLKRSIVRTDGYIISTGLRNDQRVLQAIQHCDTSLEESTAPVGGVYAVGDCVDTVYRQAITAAADGCKAALEAEKYLRSIGVTRTWE